MVEKLSFEEYKSIYSKVPRLGVEVVIRMDGGIVLAKRDIEPFKCMWHVPGGAILFGESIADAAKRIAKEETGLDISIKEQNGVKEFSREGMFIHAFSVIVIAEAIGGKLQGYEYGRDVQIFKKIPNNTIKDHVEILSGVGMI